MQEKMISLITTKYKVINIKKRKIKNCKEEKKQELSVCSCYYFKPMYTIRICSDKYAYSRLLKI